MEYSNLDKKQLASLEKRLREWSELLQQISTYEENIPLFEIIFVTDPLKNRIGIQKIENKRPPTQYGSRQRAHTLAYSALIRSLVNHFKDLSLTSLKELLQQFHKELNILYVSSITTESLKRKGRKAVFGKLGLHELVELADKVFVEILYQNEKDLFTKIPSLLKIYLTCFVYMHNRFVDAVVDQDSKNRGEGAALEAIEKLGNSFGASNKTKNELLMYLSWLIDEEAVKTAISKSEGDSKGLISFQILGIYRLISAYPDLSKQLCFDDFFSPFTKTNRNLIAHLAYIIFYKFSNAKELMECKPQEKELQLVTDSLAWLQEASRVTNPSAALSTIH